MEQGEDNEISVQPRGYLVVLCQYWSLSSDKQAMIMLDTNVRGN